jgi:hypothetical protein
MIRTTKVVIPFWLLLLAPIAHQSVGASESTNIEIKKVIESAGYVFAQNASGMSQLDDDCFVVRAYDNQDYSHESLLLVCGDRISPIESHRFPGETILIETMDLNDDKLTDIVVNELFEVGGARSTWSIRAYLNSETFQLVLDVESATIPELVDLTGDGNIEIVTTTNRYGFDQRSTLSPTVFVLKGQTYAEAESDAF